VFVMILIGTVAGVWAQTPPATKPEQPPNTSQAFGAPPSLPMSPVDWEALSEEDRATVERFRRTKLPPGSSFSDLLAIWLEPRPYPLKSAIIVDDKYAYSHPVMAMKMEIVKIEGDTIWLRGISPEDPESPLHKLWERWQISEWLTQDRMELRKTEYFLDFEDEVVPPPFVDSISFEPVVSGLPTRGRWQMSFATADMNGDGILDLVFPPERQGTPRPTIFLGEGDGKFSYWKEQKWGAKVPWDYGGIVVADFDKDGHLDVALAVHFKAQYLVYGDGQGGFNQSVRLPSPDPRITSRALAAGDFNGDGLDDLAVLAEVNYDVATSSHLKKADTLWLVMNRGQRLWEVATTGIETGRLIGDVIKVADLNLDNRPDIMLSSNTSNWRSLVLINAGERGWNEVENTGVLSAAYHMDVELGADESGRRDVYATFLQYRKVAGRNQARTGVIAYPWLPQGLGVPGTPIVVNDKRVEGYLRLALGDLNGDGLQDLVTSQGGKGLQVFIQVAPGNFYLETSPELDIPGKSFDIKLLDLNGDGLDDIVGAFVMGKEEDRPGGVRVWLTRPGSAS
jgi:hypothetical protein